MKKFGEFDLNRELTDYELENFDDFMKVTPDYVRTTANVRFRWLKAIFTQIAKATSYIRKRCTTFQV